RARPRRGDRCAGALPRARAPVRAPCAGMPERRASRRGTRGADRRRRQPQIVMAVLDRIDTLAPIRDKVEAGVRLDFEDGLALFESDDLLGLGELADRARRLRGGGDEVYFVQNLYLNQTNVCRVKCKFCAFAVTQKQAGAYTYTGEELVEDAVRQHELTGFTEIHMVGGESPHVDFDYYVEIVRSLHEALPDVHLKLFTASEIHHMTKLSGLTHEQVLRTLHDAGLGSLP